MGPEEIEVPVWLRTGTMLIKRNALPSDHAESTYRYIKNKLGLVPEEYGIYPSEPEDSESLCTD